VRMRCRGALWKRLGRTVRSDCCRGGAKRLA
jgi:hypothetical protein